MKLHAHVYIEFVPEQNLPSRGSCIHKWGFLWYICRYYSVYELLASSKSFKKQRHLKGTFLFAIFPHFHLLIWLAGNHHYSTIEFHFFCGPQTMNLSWVMMHVRRRMGDKQVKSLQERHERRLLPDSGFKQARSADVNSVSTPFHGWRPPWGQHAALP